MKTIRKIEIVPMFVEFVPEELEQNIIYISKEYRTAVHLCLTTNIVIIFINIKYTNYRKLHKSCK